MFREARKCIFGKVNESDIALKINDQHAYTVEQVTQYAVMGLGIVFFLSAILIRLGAYRFGAILLVLV